jgi:hypothetical protein
MSKHYRCPLFIHSRYSFHHLHSLTSYEYNISPVQIGFEFVFRGGGFVFTPPLICISRYRTIHHLPFNLSSTPYPRLVDYRLTSSRLSLILVQTPFTE